MGFAIYPSSFRPLPARARTRPDLPSGGSHPTIKKTPYGVLKIWGGWIRTNEMAVPKTAALPLGDTPLLVRFLFYNFNFICQYFFTIIWLYVIKIFSKQDFQNNITKILYIRTKISLYIIIFAYMKSLKRSPYAWNNFSRGIRQQVVAAF